MEEEKTEQERGHYLTPEVFGQPEEMGIMWLYHGDMKREEQALEQKRQSQVATSQPRKPSAEASGLD